MSLKAFSFKESVLKCRIHFYSFAQASREKCARCSDPILETTLKALDRSYHPNCFTCSQCSLSLDGIQVDRVGWTLSMSWSKKNLSNFSSLSRTTTRPFAGRATPGRCLAVFRPSHEMNFVCDCETNQTLYTPTAPEEMRPHFTFRRERQREGDSRSLTTERGRKKLPFPTLCFLEVGRFCSGLILEQLS